VNFFKAGKTSQDRGMQLGLLLDFLPFLILFFFFCLFLIEYLVLPLFIAG